MSGTPSPDQSKPACAVKTSDDEPGVLATIARFTAATVASFVVWKLAEVTIGQKIDEWAAERRRRRAVERAEKQA